MEIIGRFIIAAALMLGACVVGVVCSLTVYLILRVKKRRSGRACLIAGLFPPTTMAFWLACLITSSALSGLVGTPDLAFGDINEALPNAYRLKALDKMPEAGNIEKADDSIHGVGWVRSLQVDGPYVFGKYDYTYSPRTPAEAGRDYFLFDTRNGQTTNYSTENQLANAANTKLQLIPTESFRGPETAVQKIATAVLLLIVALPLAVGIWLLHRLAMLTRSVQPPLSAPASE